MKQNHIAIVGAGASGIIKAIYLKQKGYKVTLYEKGKKIAGSTSTLFKDDKPYDLSTKLIPAISLKGHYVQEDFLNLVKDSGFEMATYPDAIFYDFVKDKRVKIPEPLKDYSIFKILSDFVKGYEFLCEIEKCYDVEDIHQRGLCLPSENIQEWGKRTRLEAFSTFSAYVLDLFCMGPSRLLPASYCMASRLYYLTPYLHKFLSKQPFATIVKLHPFWNKNKDLVDFISRPSKGNYLYFKDGYEPFFHRLVEKHQLDVKLESEISGIRHENEKVIFESNGITNTADSLIFCCPLHHASQSVVDQELAKLMKQAKPEIQTRVWVLELNQWNSMKFPEPALLGDGKNPLRMGKPDMIAKSDVYGIEKFYTDPIALAAVYLDPKDTDKERQNVLENSLSKMDSKLGKINSYEDFEYSYPELLQTSKNGWYSKINHLQGKNGLYYSGQILCGTGVVTIAAYSRKFIDKHF